MRVFPVAHWKSQPTIVQPIANWKVDTGNTRFLDYAGSYNPINNGSAITEINGFGGQKAIQFKEASGTPVQIAHDTALQPTNFSICAWVYLTDDDEFNIIAGKYDDRSVNPSNNNLREYGLTLHGGILDFRTYLFSNTQSIAIASDSVNYVLNQWVFVYSIFDVSNLQIKIGVNNYAPIVESLPSGWTTNTNTGLFTIGGTRNTTNPNSRMINGAIQQVLFFNQAINQDTIDYWYNNGNGRF